jgi:hypothetical protein
LNSQNFSRFRNSDQVPTQDFQKSIGIGREGGKIIELSHDAGMSAKVNERQAEAKRGPVMEKAVTLREALRRPNTAPAKLPWAQPNGKGGAK